MITLFAGALRYVGLSQVEAAEQLGISLQSVKNWSAGRSVVPGGIWAELAAIARRRDAAVDRLRPLALADAEAMMRDGAIGDLSADLTATALAAAMLTSTTG